MKKLNNYIRVISLAMKAELHTLARNKGALLILVGAVVIYPVIYSIAYSPNVLRELPIAIIDQDQTSTSRTLHRMIDATEQVDISYRASSLKDAEKAFENQEVYGIVLIPEGFEADIIKGEQTSISTYCDASYILMYKQTISGVLQSSLTFSAGVEIKRLLTKGIPQEQAMQQIQPFKNKMNMLYNPAGSYNIFVMPALIIFIIQQTLLIGIGMMGGYQRERGRHVHTIRGFHRFPSAIVLGKSLAYVLVSVINMIFALGFIHFSFGFPAKSDFLTMLLLLLPYLMATIFMGISISGIFRKAEHSIMMLVFLSMILVFTTGFSWPVSSLPPALQILRYLFPANIVIPAYLRIRTMGVAIGDVQFELLSLIIQMVIYYLIAVFILKSKQVRSTKH